MCVCVNLWVMNYLELLQNKYFIHATSTLNGIRTESSWRLCMTYSESNKYWWKFGSKWARGMMCLDLLRSPLEGTHYYGSHRVAPQFRLLLYQWKKTMIERFRKKWVNKINDESNNDRLKCWKRSSNAFAEPWDLND